VVGQGTEACALWCVLCHLPAAVTFLLHMAPYITDQLFAVGTGC
jgi:hypothetical protein